MTGKYIKILTALGLIAIVTIQSLWLMNTYQLLETQLVQASNRLFPKAVIDEAIERLKAYKESADDHVDAVKSFSWEESSNEQAMLDFVTTTLHHYADSLSHTSVSLPLLEPEAPLAEIPAHAFQLHPEMGKIFVGAAVPGMAGGKLGQIAYPAVFHSLPGDIRILHIHKIALIKTAHFPEHSGAHAEKASGAELDIRDLAQVLIQHGVMVPIGL